MSFKKSTKQNKKEIESKPAKFKQDKAEFNKIYNQVKDFARSHATGIAKTQMKNELRKRLGVEPIKFKHNYKVLQQTLKKAKEHEQENKMRAQEEKLVMANSLLPTKQKKKREKTLKTTSGELHDGILKFDIEKDNQIKFNTSYGFDKKRNGKTGFNKMGFNAKGKKGGKGNKGKKGKKR